MLAIALPIGIGLAALAVAIVALVPAFRGDRRSAEVFRWQQNEDIRRLASSQPNPIATGASLGIDGQSVPQWLNDRDYQTVNLENPGGSPPIDLRGVLFRATTFYPEANRPTNQPFMYWYGRLTAPLQVGGQCALTMNAMAHPLTGDERIIPGYTLNPHNTESAGIPGQHWYFARLTLTFQDTSHRTLAAVFDLESEVINGLLTQTMKTVAGPTVVTQSLSDLIDQAQSRQKRVIRQLPQP